jgi:hypothetical protein
MKSTKTKQIKPPQKITPPEFPELLSTYLADRGIAPEQAGELGLSYLSPEETKKETGSSMEAIGIEYRTPDGSKIIEKGETFRRYRVFPKEDSFLAKAKDLPKFLQPSGTSNHLYFPPVVDWESVVADPDVTIGITEGELKAMCACLHDLRYIGLGGVYGWMTRQDGVSVPLPELDLIVWKDRKVELTFDNDVSSKLEVKRALSSLRKELIRRGAVVSIVKLPDDGKKVGLDDYLVQYGPGKFDALPREELKSDPVIEGMNRKHAAIMVNGASYYLTEEGRRFCLSGERDMKIQYESDLVKFTKPDGTILHKSRFDYWRTHPDRRQFSELVFRPDGCGQNQFNMWRGFTYEPKRGNCSIFLDHLKRNICGKDPVAYSYLIKWMAHTIQKPEEKPGVAIVLQGDKGSGKSIVGTIFGALFGYHYIAIADPQYIVGNFNSSLEAKLVVLADEALFAGDPSIDGKLKALITEDRLLINNKGMKTYETDNYLRLIITSNAFHVVHATTKERRFLVLAVQNGNIQDHTFFGRMRTQMDTGGYEALMYHLKEEVDLTDFDVRQVPKTDALEEQVVKALTPIESFLVEFVVGPEFPADDGIIPSSRVYGRYQEVARDRRDRHIMGEAEFGSQLRKYIPGVYRGKKRSNGRLIYVLRFPFREECMDLLKEKLGVSSIEDLLPKCEFTDTPPKRKPYIRKK